MASGILGELDCATNTWQAVYSVGSAYVDTITVAFCNRGDTVAYMRMATTEYTLTPSESQYLEYRVPLAAAGNLGNVYERTVVLDGNRKVVVWGSLSHVSVVAFGFED